MYVPPQSVIDFANQCAAYVQRKLGIALTFDSETLPVLDHYLREVPREAQAETLELVITTAGAYFGETVRKVIGGQWDTSAEDPKEWLLRLPVGVGFSPAGFVATALARNEVAEFEDALDVPARLRPHVTEALGRMGELTEDEYYSLGGRFDTLEHLHETLVAIAAELAAKANPDHAQVDDAQVDDAQVDDTAPDVVN